MVSESGFKIIQLLPKFWFHVQSWVYLYDVCFLGWLTESSCQGQHHVVCSSNDEHYGARNSGQDLMGYVLQGFLSRLNV